MIPNFNFFDIYGYLLPGFTLLTLMWLPYGLIGGNKPPTALASALVVVILGYVVGHVLQTLARKAVSFEIRDSWGAPRFPSDVFLDAEDKTFSREFKNQLAGLIKTKFDLDVITVEDEKASSLTDDRKKLSKRRSVAFFLCRSTLINNKTAAYAEQLEGMYALMVGLTIAFGFGSIYNAGWALGGLKREIFQKWFWIAVLVGLLGTAIFTQISKSKKSSTSKSARETIFTRELRRLLWEDQVLKLETVLKTEVLTVASLLLALFALGYILGSEKVMSVDQRGLIGIIAVASLVGSLRCLAEFKYFAQEFAKTVYRDFYNYEMTKGKEDKEKDHSPRQFLRRHPRQKQT